MPKTRAYERKTNLYPFHVEFMEHLDPARSWEIADWVGANFVFADWRCESRYGLTTDTGPIYAFQRLADAVFFKVRWS